ncbi:hypothetical protein A1O1_06286 [Capronia coronata CBS 617.96]|uniref:DNA replication regulator Sld3 C-terminal domain-containing protein n=1 Tax=Capronia coronata CBS 617.96 TaxID=1182541 RepID=W9XZG0_9EURO|nr:uncharacterized protein A1O1_06286 [Capronia coronata CBS 617.96]EXJ85917.1 hypothetical protein A1O1_06286 [Capronia coronata CBS 617.96]
MLPRNPTERSVLVPATSSSLNVTSRGPDCNSRKRKSDVIDAGDLEEETFTARSLPLEEEGLAFCPIALIARACLPLAWLDTSQALPSPVVEATISSVQEWEQRVLVARRLPNGGLYAVERVGNNTYVACALHNWVSQDWCKDAAIGKVARARVEDLLKREDGAGQRHSRAPSSSSFVPALPTPKSPRRPTNRRGALARMSILNPRDLMGEDTTSQTSSSPRTLEPVIVPSPTTALFPITPAAQIREEDPFHSEHLPTEVATEPAHELAQEPERVLDVAAAVEEPCAPERLRNQYFEHLYASKTSLAFYVKGPLSRARAHVRSAAHPSTAIADLAGFYDQSILATKKIDLKYKESLSSIVKGLASTSEQDGQDVPKKRKKKKKQQQQKLGKDCLWPEEEDFIKKWWRGRDFKPAMNGPSLLDELRRELADLRMRETKMQMLLVLELMLLNLAIVKLSETQDTATGPEVKVESIEEDPSAILAKTPQKQKPKKKRDLVGELDTIVDRLCIWHTVSQDELSTTTNSANSSTAAKASDSLRDFCKDVLLPFYSAKLPEQVKSLSRKLGGPEISPKRPKPVARHQGQKQALAPPTALTRSSSFSSLARANSKPGQPQMLDKRTLERVLSEDQAHRHASPPTSLSRSATAPLSAMNAVIPALKREPSERPLSRGGMSMLAKSSSFSNREIDLVADCRAHEAKRRKLDRLAQQKRELEAAIEALRRPSRGTVASAFMDEVEKRGEKTKTVQITATPRARRIGDRSLHIGHSQDLEHGHAEPELPPIIPSLSLPGHKQDKDMMIVPSSTAKPRQGVSRPGISGSGSMGLPSNRSSATKRAVLSAIHETPSRGVHNKTSNPLDLPRLVSSANGDGGRDGGGDYYSAVSAPSLSSASVTRSGRPVLFTTVRKSEVSVEQAFRDAPEIPERAGKTMDRVMGGKTRALPAGFGAWDDADQDKLTLDSNPRGTQNGSQTRTDDATVSTHPITVTVQTGAGDEAGDIYAKLGWNDDDFDI